MIRQNIGIVVIGRNEEKFLRRCFEALENFVGPIVYVDSASTDGSLDIAHRFEKIHVLRLDESKPLTAARGRNAGFAYLKEAVPNIAMIQFIDGDCALDKNWLEQAAQVLEQREDVAIVSGILQELDSDKNWLKQLSAMEWQKVAGEIKATGGNCLVKVGAFEAVNGFNPLIAGAEDDEFCLRVRMRGWKILHLPISMAVHDVGESTFRNYWNRSLRTGYAFSQLSWIHRDAPEKIFLKENISTWIFGGIIPILAIVLVFWTKGFSLGLFLIYPILFARIYMQTKKKWGSKKAALYAASCVLAKFPGFLGSLKFYFNLLAGKASI